MMEAEETKDMQETKEPKRRRPLVVIAVAGLVVVCLCLAGVMLLGGDDDGQPAAAVAPAATVAAAETAAPPPEPAATTAITSAPVPTATPEPTATTVPTATPEPMAMAGVGDRVEEGGIALTVLDARREMQVSEFMTPAEGNVYLVIEALIENVSRDEAPYNLLYFSAKDSDGFQYSPSFVGASPAIQSGTLTQGDRARGFVTFEVREVATGVVVTYEPQVLFGSFEPLRVVVEE